MTQEEGRATRQDERAPRHQLDSSQDKQRHHDTAPPPSPTGGVAAAPIRPSRRIFPARLADLPSVLDSRELCCVLRVGEDTLRELVHSGELHRLAYSRRDILVSSQEVRRFLREQSRSIARRFEAEGRTA